MKIGLIARADNTGLGNQTWQFFRHMHPYRTMVVDISRYNGNKQYYERYGENQFATMFVNGMPTPSQIDYFLQELDVVFVAESPYNYYLYQKARELGVKTAVQYNYEFFDWFVNPNYPKPDMLIAPSQWHYETIQQWCDENHIKHIYLHCPVNREELPRREIKKAKTFLHVAGKAAAHDRNGTMTVLQAAQFIESEAKILIHFQGEQGLPHQATNTIAEYQAAVDHVNKLAPDKIKVRQQDYIDYTDIYAEGDVLLLPRRYGGNCLPLNEGLSVGMPVIMPNISPNNYLLPADWLLPAQIVGEFTPRTKIDIYEVSPMALAAKIDWLAEMNEERFKKETEKANHIASQISWYRMRYKYQDALEELCTQS